VNISKINAGAAGVESLIDFNVCDFEDTDIPETQALFILTLNTESGWGMK